MNKRKIFIGLATFVAIIGINLLALKPNPAKADWYCNGRVYKQCPGNTAWVWRCTCTGGQICYASWQDLCPEPQ